MKNSPEYLIQIVLRILCKVKLVFIFNKDKTPTTKRKVKNTINTLQCRYINIIIEDLAANTAVAIDISDEKYHDYISYRKSELFEIYYEVIERLKPGHIEFIFHSLKRSRTGWTSWKCLTLFHCIALVKPN
jgi:uncharacterized ferritin-like protein (DUF455 family)